jgi:uncharacterized protein (TIGR00645 family)
MWHDFIHPKLKRNYFEDAILYGRYLMVPMYITLLYSIVLISFDFVQTMFGFEGHLTEHIMRILELLDISMITNLIWYVSAGSYYVFVHTYDPHTHSDNQPRVLNHISSGLLKEKLAMSLVGVSSVHLLQTFMLVSTSDTPVDFNKLIAMGSIHVLFLVGILVFNYANCKADGMMLKEKKNEEREIHHSIG